VSIVCQTCRALTEMSLLAGTRIDDIEVLRSAVTTAVKEIVPETPVQVLPMRRFLAAPHGSFAPSQ
jgi:hypothetical protein